MKVVMINDCAFVGETLLKYLPPEIEKQHIKRGSSLWSKTFSLAYDILKSKGCVYHANYLLQDCYIASRLGKHPLIGHAHGSDLRISLKHMVWSRIVRHNLEHCDRVLVSTPDLLEVAKTYSKEVQYSPNPIDTEIFYPKPLVSHEGKMRVLIASSLWLAKGTDVAIDALSELSDDVDVSVISYGVDYAKVMALAKSRDLTLTSLPRLNHDNMREYFWDADLVIDQFRCGVVGNVFLEAVACGRPAIGYVSSEFPEYAELPLKNINSSDKLVEAIEKTSDWSSVWKSQYEYVKAWHEASVIVKNVLKLYHELCAEG